MFSNLIVTSPAASVCSSSVLPSDFTTVPVRRSPFFNVTRSANRADDSANSVISANSSNLRTVLPPPKVKLDRDISGGLSVQQQRLAVGLHDCAGKTLL